MSKYGVFSGPYFPSFRLNTERYEVFLGIQPECGKIRTRINSVFGYFSRSVNTFISENCPQCLTIFSTATTWYDKANANLTVRQLTHHVLQLKIDVVDNRNIQDRCIGREGLHLYFSGKIQWAKNFMNFIKKFRIVKECSGVRNLLTEPVHPLTLFSDVAFERSKTTVIRSDNDISHDLFRKVSGSVDYYLSICRK